MSQMIHYVSLRLIIGVHINLLQYCRYDMIQNL